MKKLKKITIFFIVVLAVLGIYKWKEIDDYIYG
jgi:hypothetical protein